MVCGLPLPESLDDFKAIVARDDDVAEHKLPGCGHACNMYGYICKYIYICMYVHMGE